jgi:hypothetical protein
MQILIAHMTLASNHDPKPCNDKSIDVEVVAVIDLVSGFISVS